jgi:hypothetical protein
MTYGVAFDGSDRSVTALERAVEHARHTGNDIYTVRDAE